MKDKPHKKQILSMGLNRPYQLAFDKIGDKLFFSHNIGDDDEDAFEIGYIEGDKKLPKTVDSVKNGFAIAIDNNNEIFFGGSDGIYKQNLTGNATQVLKKHNIWDMFFKKALYFITYPSQRLYKLNGDEAELLSNIHEKIYQFVIDGDDDKFITNDTGVFMIKNGTQERVYYKGAKVYRAVEVNNRGEAYFCSKNGIYVANKTNDELHLIAPIKHTFGIAFDGDDHIIYSDSHEIVKLQPGKCK